MLLLRALGGAFLVLSLYYARFFALRQEPTTLLQMVTLWCAAGWLLLAVEPSVRGGVWFHGWLPVNWRGWAVFLGAAVVAALVFVVLDRDSHSVSDTLNRIAPTYALVVALVLRLRYERTLITML